MHCVVSKPCCQIPVMAIDTEQFVFSIIPLWSAEWLAPVHSLLTSPTLMYSFYSVSLSLYWGHRSSHRSNMLTLIFASFACIICAKYQVTNNTEDKLMY